MIADEIARLRAEAAKHGAQANRIRRKRIAALMAGDWTLTQELERQEWRAIGLATMARGEIFKIQSLDA